MHKGTVAVLCPLQALTSYGLQGHAQHMELLQCPGLVQDIVQQLAPEPQLSESQQPARSGHQLTAAQAQRAEAALEAAISLTISHEGLQVWHGCNSVGRCQQLNVPLTTAVAKPQLAPAGVGST
jgi:hypothetical protein